MSSQHVLCPYCQASLTDDGSLAGQTVACPACGGQLIMPGVAPLPLAHPTVSGIRPPAERVGGGKALRKHRRSRATAWMLGAGAVVFFVILGAWFFSSFGSKTGGMTKVEFHRKADALRIGRGTGSVYKQAKEADVINTFGPPVRTQTVGIKTFWYWTCRDGTIQMVLHGYDPGRGGTDKIIYVEEINDY
jgi:hypothetical protein